MSAQTVADGVREYVMAGMQTPTFEDERRVRELLQVRGDTERWTSKCQMLHTD